MKHIQYSIIIPLPQLEDILQKYRFQFNFFAKHGIPTHLTLLYNFPKSFFDLHKNDIIKSLQIIADFLKDKSFILDKLIFSDNLVSINFDDSSTSFIINLQLYLAKFLHFDNKYINFIQKPYMKPHITLFTNRIPHLFKKGIINKNIISRNLTPKLPITIKFHKIWLLQINTNINEAILIKEFLF